jgi:hypothetical protein
MAKDKKKDRDRDRGKGSAGSVDKAARGDAGHAAGEHRAAKAHGRATQVDESLPGTRPELMALHASARARRNGAPLDSPDFRAAVMDLERIEIRIAAVDRAADPPLG